MNKEVRPALFTLVSPITLFTLFALAPAAHGQNGARQPAPRQLAEPARLNAAAAIPKPQPGHELLLQAHRRTKSATAVTDYTAILALCQQGIRQGLNSQYQPYARQLMGWAYNRRGELLVRQGQRAVALADFEAAVENDPERWRAVHNRGLGYALLGRYDQAIADFDRTIELKPTFVDAWFNRGETYGKLGNFELALADYSRAIELAPDDAAIFNRRGNAHYRLGQLRQAIDDYNVALELSPANAIALTNRGDIYSELGHYEEAVTDYRAAIEADPELTRAFLSAAWLMATCPDSRWRSAEGALEALSHAETSNSTSDPNYLDILAAAHANAGNFDQACTTLEHAIKLASAESAETYQNRLALYERDRPYRLSNTGDALPPGEGPALTQERAPKAKTPNERGDGKARKHSRAPAGRPAPKGHRAGT